MPTMIRKPLAALPWRFAERVGAPRQSSVMRKEDENSLMSSCEIIRLFAWL